MSKDDFDIYTHLRKDSKRAALNLINGLENRRYGYLFGCRKSKEDLDIYAEEEFIRKKDYEELRCEMPGVPRSTFLMVFSPDGSKVASTHGNHNIYITDIKSGKNIKTLVGHPRTPWCIAFHPTSDQIVASGCLGGQVRIWDLSGGSEVWTAAHQTVIASLAFHPNDRVLVIATYNEVYFWDWSQPEPFVHAATSNPKEKVRYVAFDNLGHKLITGIANSPQTRWERVRAPVPVPRQAMCSNPYRRRITQRLANPPGTSHSPSDSRFNNREGSIDLVPNIPLRERRITACYRNLVREYEQLVQRYLQLYRPPTMIDRGTDPMEPNPWFNNSGTQTSNDQTESSDGSTPGPSTVNTEVNTTIRNNPEPGPSTSAKAEGNGTEQPSTSDSTTETHTLITPSRIFNTMKKPETSFRGTQTVESRKHKADAASGEPCQEKRFKKSDKRPLKRSANRATSETAGTSTEGQNQEQRGSEVQSQEQRSREGQQEQRRDEKALRVELEQLNSPVEVSIGPESTASVSDTSEFRIRSRVEEEAMSNMSSDQALAESNNTDPEVETTHPMASEIRQSTAPLSNSQNLDGPSTSISSDSSRNPTINGVEELLLNIRRTAEEEVRNRILPIINSVPANDRPELIRLFENGREHVRKRVRQMYPVFLRRPNRRHLNIIDSSESSTSDEDNSNSDSRLSRCNLEGPSHVTSQTSVTTNSTTSISGASSSTPSVTSSSSVRNFNTELEQLVTSLLTEIERDDDRSPRSGTLPSASLITNTSTPSTPTTTPTPLLPNPFSPSSSQLGEASTASTPSNRPFSSLLFQECLRVLNSRDDTPPTSTASTISAGSTPITSSTAQDVDNRASSAEAPPATGVNTNTRTTNSTIYTSISLPRRRFFSHRISAFMPTRVDYHRLARLRRSPHISGGRARPSPFFHWQSALDEIINYAERENSEDDPPPPTTPPLHPPSHESSFSSLDPLPDPPRTDHVSNIYSNILHDIEFSLDDVLSMRASDILGINNTHMRSFSERLDSIVNQSDQILRNVANSMEMMSNAEEPSPNRSQGADPAWSTVYDNNFFMRERSESSNLDLESRNDTINLSHLFHTPISTAIATDHTYPRNPDSASAGQSEDMTPIMSLIHMTISHIQRQAQQVRQRVEVLERIDRANIEISQLQLIRQLLIELTRYVRSGDVRNRSTGGMSSVRQMMAGTRISDSSPQESTSEESPSTTTPPVVPPSSSSSSNVPTSSTEEPSTSSGQARSRASSRKTYPPSRLYRLSARPYRKHSMYQFIGRRYLNRGGAGSARQGSARTTAAGGLLPLGISHEQYLPSEGSSTRPLPAPPRPPSALPLTANTLSMTTRRLERRLVEQMRVFMSMQPQSQNTQNRRVDLGEHILMLRLHGCVLRMNRILGHNPVSNVLGNIRADPTAAVTRDGVARFGPRHNLSLLIDDISRNVEGGPGNLHFLLRCQILRMSKSTEAEECLESG
ncbi:unnamed protein product [Acanthoscelides obtectus]|uniref:Activating molecule in BECN1-regulated autophagy protein 1 n=1 Tax=Acanthoscelides obtectus TaxID=200917 RepID=A0A9P0K8S6_ACAOB|nr:unnamed protein product [Acanthoscelides obtectus]CAK1622681.1 Activating molecule in BECN1-regulated autophagy protein 1 [Acanthoscelides obtectus]